MVLHTILESSGFRKKKEPSCEIPWNSALQCICNLQSKAKNLSTDSAQLLADLFPWGSSPWCTLTDQVFSALYTWWKAVIVKSLTFQNLKCHHLLSGFIGLEKNNHHQALAKYETEKQPGDFLKCSWMSLLKIHLFREVAIRSCEGPLAAPGAILIPRIHHCFDSSGLKRHFPKWDRANSPEDCVMLQSLTLHVFLYVHFPREWNEMEWNRIE